MSCIVDIKINDVKTIMKTYPAILNVLGGTSVLSNFFTIGRIQFHTKNFLGGTSSKNHPV